jgi:predicted Fe-Mo cluster-binding NifX family protein
MRRRSVIFLISAFVSLLVIAYSQKPPKNIKSPQAVVPSLEGQELAVAREEVRANFELVSSYENSDQPEGTVIVQSPEPGTTTERGTSISVVVSDGPEIVQLPDVVGKVRDEAEEDLSDAGFKIKVKTQESTEEAVGKVLEQSPTAGAVKKGSEVTITIGEGHVPAPGYNLIQDPTGGLTVEVPPSWGVDTGEDSEYPSGVQSKSWSTFQGEMIPSSITTAPSLDAWYSEPATGAYIVASRTLAQNYSDDELIYSGLFSDLANYCEEGFSEEFQRSSLSGKMQTWYNCRGLGITNVMVAAAPEGRECVVVLQARIVDEANQEAVQHILDTFDVDCNRVS